MNKERVNKLLEAAVQAPSGDNVQPWEFKVSKDYTHIDLFNLPERDNSYYNFEQAASYIAHGALIENMLIAGRYLGCNVEYQLFPDQKNPDWVASIELSEAAPQPDPLYDAIFKRQTNRFFYKKRRVTSEELNSIQASVKDFDGVELKLVVESEKINRLAKILMVNDRIVFERKDIHQFLFDKIRWTKEETESTGDGMPVGVLGLSRIEKLFFPFLRFWVIVKLFNIFGLSKIIELKCGRNLRNSLVLGMVSVKSGDRVNIIKAGMVMQRIWLNATLLGFAFQPIVGLTLLMHRLKNSETVDLSMSHTKIVKKACKMLPKYFELKESDVLIIGFRMGCARLVEFRTERVKII